MYWPTEWSAGVLARLAQQIKGDEAKVRGHRMEAFSPYKLGVAGTHQLLTIDLMDGTSVTVFVKGLPAVPDNEIADYKEVFNQEAFFYDAIVMQLAQVSDYSEKWCPKTYGIEGDYILLENLRPLGYTVRDDITNKYMFLRSALKSLARLHAASILAEKKPQNFKWATYFQTNEVKERIFTDDQRAGEFVRRGIDLAIELSKGDKFDCVDPAKMRSAFEAAIELLHTTKGFVCGLCHGHVDRRNLLYNDATECVLIDFQTYRYAPIVSDIVHLLYLHTTKKYRKDNVNKLLADYHAELTKAMKSDTIIAKAPPLRRIKEEFHKFELYGMALAAIIKPTEMMYFDEGRIFNNHTEWRKFVFEDRLQKTLWAMKTYKPFEDMVNEAIADLCAVLPP